MPRRLILLVCILTTCPYVGLNGQAGGQSAPVVPQIRKGTGFILGRTVDVGTGQPVAGALVTLTGYGDVPGGVPGGPQAAAPVAPGPLTASRPRSVITNADGYFFFRELNGGRFSIGAGAMGYLDGGYLKSKPTGAVHFLDLGENEQRGDVQIRLWKYAALSGTVRDEAGEPAVGASVRVFQRTFAGGRAQLRPSGGIVLTDDRGVYRAGGLTPGDYVVGIVTTQSTIPATLAEAYASAVAESVDPTRAPPMMGDLANNGVASPYGTGVRMGDLIFQLSGTSRLGYTPPQPSDDGRVLAYTTTFFPHAATATEATPITLGSGEERSGVDLAIALVPTVHISGVLMGPDGPAKNMGVRLVPAGSDLFIDDSFIVAATAVTDANGAFTFLAAPPGTYTLKASRSLIVRTRPATPADRLLWAQQPITADTTDITGVNVTLRPGLSVSGHVEFVGSKPAPPAQMVQAITIGLISVQNGQMQRSAQTLATADGKFTTLGDLPGRYFVNASALPGWNVRSITQAGKNVADDPIELTSRDVDDLVVTYIDTTAKISGTIADAKGTPDAQADVIVFPADSDGWRRGEFNIRRIQILTATKAGTFASRTLPAGQYYVVAADNSVTGEWTNPQFLQKLIAGATKVTIAEGDDKTVALKTLAVK
jgi:hypothetical protein